MGLSRRRPAPYLGIAQNAGMRNFGHSKTAFGARRALLAALAACAAGLGAGPARAAHLVRPWAAGRPVPKLELNDLDGKPWSLASARGQVVVMNFWATWCEPCRSEMPSLELFAQKYEHDALTVVAINYQEPIPAIRRFLDAQPVTLPILLDRNGAATGAWTPRVFPSTVLVDRNGQPQNVVLGELDWTGSVARELIAPLLPRAKAT
jgi:thiol-disulfide isomerase/thioredoxin